MKHHLLLSALTLPIAGLLQAQPEHTAYEQLAKGLRDEVRLLRSVTDAESAQRAVEPLRALLGELAALRQQVDEKELWRYIDNTEGVKQPLIEEIERLFVQYKRLEQARCYGCKALAELMAPLFNPVKPAA